MNESRRSILFVCTGNSARSLIAEALCNDRLGPRLVAESAGARPTGRPNPLALETLARHGVPATGLRSKGLEEFEGRRFDLAVTVCGDARDTCPVFGGAAATVHWGLPDPPAADDPEAAFEAVYAALEEAIAELAKAEGEDPSQLARRATEAGRRIAQRFPDA